MWLRMQFMCQSLSIKCPFLRFCIRSCLDRCRPSVVRVVKGMIGDNLERHSVTLRRAPKGSRQDTAPTPPDPNLERNSEQKPDRDSSKKFHRRFQVSAVIEKAPKFVLSPRAIVFPDSESKRANSEIQTSLSLPSANLGLCIDILNHS